MSSIKLAALREGAAEQTHALSSAMTWGQLPLIEALFIMVPGTLSWCVHTPFASHATCAAA